MNQNAESCPEELVLLEIRDLRRRGVRGELRPSDGTPGLFFISAIQGRTFEIFLEEYKEHESWIAFVQPPPVISKEKKEMPQTSLLIIISTIVIAAIVISIAVKKTRKTSTVIQS